MKLKVTALKALNAGKKDKSKSRMRIIKLYYRACVYLPAHNPSSVAIIITNIKKLIEVLVSQSHEPLKITFIPTTMF